MSADLTFKQRLRRIIFFFPLQLLFLHVKKNLVLLLFWLMLFGYVTQTVGMKYGLPYLFLSPEYLGEVNLWSYLIVGFALGGFITAFNMYTYTTHGYKFPFLATLARPFFKFSINNSIIPGLFIATFLFFSARFQWEKEFTEPLEIAINLLSFLAGISIFIILSFTYFFRTNKDIFKLRGQSADEVTEEPIVGNVLHKKAKWYVFKGKKGWVILTYLSHPFKIGLARTSGHYDEELLKKVFNQNHINASFFELLMVVSFVLLGSFREVPGFEIPAAASIMLVFTISLMLFSALYSWFKGWSLTVLIAVLAFVNYGSTQWEWMRFENQAYGLNYQTEKADYSNANLHALRDNVADQKADRIHTEKILDHWKAKCMDLNPGRKPKLVLLNTSGGGLRSALWTIRTLQHADSALNGQLFPQIQFISGSSGGMVGAAYLREIYLRSVTDPAYSHLDKAHLTTISEDVLNPISFSLATNDIFIRYQSFEYENHFYTKDRAYSFEKKLNENTGHVLDKSIADYAEAEYNATIPMLVLAPTIVNDGRRLLISSQPISYLTENTPRLEVSSDPLVENVEFSRLFEQQGASNLRFSSALRMNATFPYILPMVSLPTDPKIDVMDAGLRDNFGIKNTMQYMYTFRDWIEANTSGVVILQIRDTEKQFEVRNRTFNSLADKLTSPIGSIYGNFLKIQDYSNDQLIQMLSEWYNGHVDVITFSLPDDEKEEKVSLSWHLTSFEKKRVIQAVDLPNNQKAMEKLKQVLAPSMLTENQR